MVPTSLALALFLTAPLLPNAGGGNAGLAAAAAASGRPAECTRATPRSTSRSLTVWQAAREPNLPAYCDAVARAQAQLASRPDAARASAQEAEKLLPGHAAPAVVLARAAVVVGDMPQASAEFQRALAIDPRAVEEPWAMHDYARALLKTGKKAEALGVYRALVPRLDVYAASARRVGVLLEAAHVSMALEGEAKTGTASTSSKRAPFEEAIAFLREARRRPAAELASDVLVSLALALERAGDREQADAALAAAWSSGVELRVAQVDYVATPEDKIALEALAREGDDRAAALKAWEAFLAGPGGKGPWATAARSRLELLRRGGGGRPAGAKKGS